MDLSTAKYIAMTALSLGSLAAGLLPALFAPRYRNRYPLLVSALLCLGAGVLLATSLVHMLPEIREALGEDMAQYAELAYCAGFFLLYAVDEMMHLFAGGSGHHQHDHTQRRQNRQHEQRHHGHSHQEQRPLNPGYGTMSPSAPLLGDDYHDAQNAASLEALATMSLDRFQFAAPVSQLCHVEQQEPCTQNANVKGIGLIVALSVHALLEGLAVGLESAVSQVLILLTAISTHKLVVGFCLGVELTTAQDYRLRRHFGSIAVFSFGSAAGIGLGMVISGLPDDVSQLVLPILQALAAGTLLYVTVSEVLPRERARWHEMGSNQYAGLIQLVAVVVGFVAMTFLVRYFES